MKVQVLIALLLAAVVAVATGQENTTTASPTVFVGGNATASPTEADLNPDEDKTENDFSLPRTFMPALIVVGLMFLGRCLLYFFFTEEQNQYMMGPNTGMYLTTKKPHLTLLEIDTYTEKFKFSSEHEHVLEHRILENLTAEPSADEEEFVCAICIDSFAEEDDCRRLPCGHFFHADCVDEWFDRSIECPLCKQDVHKAYDARKKGKSPASKEEGGNGNRRLSGGLRSQFTRMLSARSAPPSTTNGAEVDLESGLETEDGKKQPKGLRNGLQKLLSAKSLGAKEETGPALAPNEVQVVVPKDNHRIHGDDDDDEEGEGESEGEGSREMDGSDPEKSENDNEKDGKAGGKEDKLSEAGKIRRSLEDEL